MTEKISVIILTMNSQKHLAICINAILMQKYPNFEIIVVDSNSTDNTLSILQNYNTKTTQIKIIKFGNHISVGKARQIGMDHAKGEILAYIDSDVELSHENWLENMTQPILNGYKSIPKEQIAGVQTLAKCRDSDPPVLKRIHASFEYKYDILDTEHYQIVGTSHLLLQKSILKKVGGFKDIYSGEDVSVMKSIMQLGYKFIYLKNEKCYHHHVDSYTTHIKRTIRGYKNRIKNILLR